ncbi:MAG: CapA family protein [Candidatus Faecousia sp.]|nr:CapA family protein [Bacillota bacterium]MDY4219622.1 CapA family protein [Candidatus Faecousia sp.]
MEQPRAVRRRRRRRRPGGIWILFLLVAAGLVFSVVQYRRDMKAPVQTATAPTEPFAAAGEGEKITIAAAGDINISRELLQSARQADGTYDFTNIFMGVSPLLSGADLTVADLEVNFCGEPCDPDAYQAPESLLEALSASGVDLVQTANTVSVYNGIAGLSSTLEAVERSGLTPVGTFATGEAYEQSGGYTIVEEKGFRIAFVAFTKGVGNLKLPEGSEHCVNLLYKDYNTTYQEVDTQGIQAVLGRVQGENPDITVALLHWGSEYDDEVSKTQEEIRKLMLENGVDVILGTHSHLVGEIDADLGAGSLTAFSLGNLLSVDETSGANQGIVLKLEFTMSGGEAKLTDYTYEPVYLAKGEETGTGRYALLDTNKVISLYESSYIDRVTQEVYESLCKSRDKVAKLVYPTEE